MSLTKKQRLILEAILFLIRKGEIPTVREVGALVGLRSPSTVFKHLRALEAEKLITISGKSRGIRLADPELLASLAQSGSAEIIHGHFPALSKGKASAATHAKQDDAVLLVGVIAAGRPIAGRTEAFLRASEEIDAAATNAVASYPSIPIDPRLFASSGDLVALQVEGDSMVEAGILDGDYVIIRRQEMVESGEIAAVLVDGEVTLKRLFRSHASSNDPASGLSGSSVRLVAANERFPPLEIAENEGKEVFVFGKYVGLVRGELQIH